MREDLLHFIWKFKKIPLPQLSTQQSETLRIYDFGLHNTNAGPDFLNARIEIDGQLWAGNVEMHLKSSDWYAHHHEQDENYNNVILHVVWEHDIDVFRKDESIIPTLELKGIIPKNILNGYEDLMDTSEIGFINCEKQIASIDELLWINWEERLYFERLEQKSNWVDKLLLQKKNDWESVLFQMLCKNFGTNVNGAFFSSRAMELDFSTVRKVSSDFFQLESLLFGHFGLLNVDGASQDMYFQKLKKEYTYLHSKFALPDFSGKPAFYGMRPTNFPTLRLSQLARLYSNSHGLFYELMHLDNLEQFYSLLGVYAGAYWEDHFTFGKISRKSRKKVSKAFIELLLINTIIPLRFCYHRFQGKDYNEGLLELISQIKGEHNSIVAGFESLGIKSQSALESQAKIQLYNHFCSKKKCLHCRIGTSLLNRNVYF